MIVFLVALFFLFLRSSAITLAQLPISFQLLYSYQPNYYYSPPNFSTPTPSPIPQVLGVSTTNPQSPPIGGDGRVVTIAVIGDSMIETLGQNIPTLATALQKYYSNIKFNILNFGRGATTLAFAQNRLPIIINQQPDVVVIESFAYNNYGNTQSGFDQHRQQLDSIVTLIRQQLPNTAIILATTITPDSVHFAQGVKDLHLSALERLEKTSTIKLYFDNFIKFAKSKNLPLADAYHPSLVNQNGNPDFINRSDYIHPSAAGVQFFCNILAKTIFDHHLL